MDRLKKITNLIGQPPIIPLNLKEIKQFDLDAYYDFWQIYAYNANIIIDYINETDLDIYDANSFNEKEIEKIKKYIEKRSKK